MVEKVRKGNVIVLDEDTVVEVYRMVREETGMDIDDINVFVLEAIETAISYILADIVIKRFEDIEDSSK